MPHHPGVQINRYLKKYFGQEVFILKLEIASKLHSVE